MKKQDIMDRINKIEGELSDMRDDIKQLKNRTEAIIKTQTKRAGE